MQEHRHLLSRVLICCCFRVQHRFMEIRAESFLQPECKAPPLDPYSSLPPKISQQRISLHVEHWSFPFFLISRDAVAALSVWACILSFRASSYADFSIHRTKLFPKIFPSMLYEILCCGRIGACLCALLASCFLLFFPPAPTHAPQDVC